MAQWLNLGQITRVNSVKFPNKIALKDKNRTYTFKELNSRVNQLANGLIGMGVKKGDKLAVLLENCTEFVEIYLAAAKTGIVVVPINFRLLEKEVEFITSNSDSKAFIVDKDFLGCVASVRPKLKKIKQKNYITVGGTISDYHNYEEFLSANSAEEPKRDIMPEDPWVILYTSGTTGMPKGVVRSHESYIAFYLINAIDFKFNENDICLTVMPLCHVNSTFFSFAVTYVAGAIYVNPARKFEPREIFETIDKEKITFISLIPTHYNLLLDVPEDKRKQNDLTSIKKLLCSSAPARQETKKAVMKLFPGVELYEAYGSTEAGIVTVLKPHEQMDKLGSIGRESSGTELIKILDEKDKPVKQGEIGELYSCGPMLFNKYYKMPDKTKESFVGKWFSAGDMARQDSDGYYYLVDRKNNMIITGGEHVFPSEVEGVICCHPKVFDVAVIGVAHPKWGEAVKAVVIPRANQQISEDEIIEFCRGKLAKFKVPKSVSFITSEEMPRTASGKILHRKLRERFSQ